MKLKIFSDRQYLLDGIPHDMMLAPFWEELIETHQYPWQSMSDCYKRIGQSLFEMVPLEDADLAIMPVNWQHIRGVSWRSKVNKLALNLALEFAKKANHGGKPIVVFFSGDCSDEKIPIDNAFVFRHALYRSIKKQNNLAIPGFCEDLVQQYFGNEIPIRQKKEKPVVGFCGLVTPHSWKKRLKTIYYQGVMLTKYGKITVSPYKGHILRNKALEILANNPAIETNFLLRDRLAFLVTASLDHEKLRPRLDFVKNMAESDYILCCRGSANYSYRLFEALCCGRIPIFINTDCVLPYEFAIDWRKYCVWIDEKELPLITEKLIDFHQSLSPQDFIDLQYKCRKLWKEWLSPEGFFSNFYRHFSEINPVWQ
ncbi:MAG TPA: exostosin [Cyanobacteria bacterium UBA12227]|nr:exostosin [Cyanobacteria bacterium UBA12227]HAX85313.1 exostosin [Cyanobacteria bacterium UBA11370]HBY81001.1 exostosin [Cyanobacteria bacterium UBA11148]